MGDNTEDKTTAQQIDDSAIDALSLQLVKNYGPTVLALNDGAPEEEKLKKLSDPYFKDENGNFDRNKFNDYIHSTAEELYKNETPFAKRSISTLGELFKDDDEKSSFIKLLKNHNPVRDAAAEVVDDYTKPIPIIGGLFKMFFGTDVSFKTVMLAIQGLFKHGFDFDAIKHDIADQATQDFHAKLAANKDLDADTVSAATKEFAKTAAEKMGATPASSAPKEDYRTVPIDIPSTSTSTPTADNGPNKSPGKSAANGTAVANTGTASIPVNQAVDDAIKKTLADHNDDVGAALEKMATATDQKSKNTYETITTIQKTFGENAKQLAVDVQSGKEPSANPKDLADKAFSLTMKGLTPKQQEALAPALPTDSVDDVVAKLAASDGSEDKDNPAKRKIEDHTASDFIKDLRNNMAVAFTNAGIFGSKVQGATDGAAASVTMNASNSNTPSTSSNPDDDIKVAQKKITEFNDAIIEASANKDTGLPAQAKEFIAIKAIENPPVATVIPTWGRILAIPLSCGTSEVAIALGAHVPDGVMGVLGRDQGATDTVRGYIEATRKKEGDKSPSERDKLDGARVPNTAEKNAFDMLHATAVSRKLAPTDAQLQFAGEAIGKITADYLNELAKTKKPLPSKEDVAIELEKRIKEQLPNMRDANKKTFDDLGIPLAVLNQNTGKDILKEVTSAAAKTLRENQPEKLANGTPKPGSIGPYDQLADGYKMLNGYYAKLGQAIASKANVTGDKLPVAQVSDPSKMKSASYTPASNAATSTSAGL